MKRKVERLFVWITASGAWLLRAKDLNGAKERVLKNRMEKGGQTREEAEGWFRKDDQLHEIDGDFDGEENE